MQRSTLSRVEYRFRLFHVQGLRPAPLLPGGHVAEHHDVALDLVAGHRMRDGPIEQGIA